MWLSPSDTAVTRGLLLAGSWQEAESELLRTLLKPGMTFLDVGANVGYFTSLAAPLVGDTGRVVAVEPDPANFAFMQKTLARAGHKNVVTLNVAAGSVPTLAALTLDPNNRGNHSLAAANVPGSCFGSVQVEVVPLGTALRGLGIEQVDVAKLDVQGWEFEALKGAWPLLGPGALIIVEFWPVGLRAAGSDPLEVAQWLLERCEILGVLGITVEIANSPALIVALAGDQEGGQLDIWLRVL